MTTFVFLWVFSLSGKANFYQTQFLYYEPLSVEPEFIPFLSPTTLCIVICQSIVHHRLKLLVAYGASTVQSLSPWFCLDESELVYS